VRRCQHLSDWSRQAGAAPALIDLADLAERGRSCCRSPCTYVRARGLQLAWSSKIAGSSVAGRTPGGDVAILDGFGRAHYTRAYSTLDQAVNAAEAS
jgi:hypothetical protein